MERNRTGQRTNQTKGSSAPGRPGGVFLGVCTRTAGGVYVKIPTLTKGSNVNFGPCKVVGLYPPVGSYVLCTFLENKNDEVVILGKVVGTNVLQNTGTPVTDTDATTKKYVDDAIALLQAQITNLQTQVTTLRNRYNSHTTHPPPA
ncbi:MAG: hypothetical protein EBT80_00095 [Chitinophagales bacterium]|nr:hypothetical protein [Chitinophagales bacterium]